ncbi:MAG: aminotransferase class I/II-fold pyridoxal phosphate-dependent enzyme [Lachnospiraceae bacterium]|nr:aminotransferase class I/II-fold pyridoxal phosphate-dependent enzyme [Lachnospiraceae bacterium]
MAHGGDIYRNKVNIDFSVNLNPLPLPPTVEKAVREGIDKCGFYPDPLQLSLRSGIAQSDGVGISEIYAGAGASQLIMATVKACEPEKALLIEPCFSGYRHALRSCKACGISEYMLKEEEEFGLTEEILGYIDEFVDLLFLTDPWNPTGRQIDKAVLEAILDKTLKTGTKVILDQSFILMSDIGMDRYNAAKLIKKYKNLFIIRSYTKFFSLPGLRMGYVIAGEDEINDLKTVLPEWNISAIASNTMEACAEVILLGDHARATGIKIREERKYLTDHLKALGIRVFDSDTAFLLIKHNKDLYTELLGKGILIRDCSDYKGLGKGFYRIAVKDHASNEILVKNIGEIINGY